MGPPGNPGVPIVPEADSLLLVLGGLAAVGGVVAVRRLRPRRGDPVGLSR
jgi:hypothetical protein